MRILSLVAAVFALAACSRTPVASVHALTITPRDAAFASGSVATLELRNLGAQEIVYNLCHHELQLRTGSGWETRSSSPTPLTDCTMELHTLAGDATAEVQIPLPADLPSGTWRVVFAHIGLTYDGTLPQSDRTSASFVVSHSVPVD